ncbi:LuxR C-terminal-related transcriptional regulator [Plantactinospora sp. CA-294935]|uniref:helix-turn-helix domain-containing protein n=1 Tax=Plantactinospora sp. CA-294935 TaxID=3240012 RepID=UPI003D8C6B30
MRTVLVCVRTPLAAQNVAAAAARLGLAAAVRTAVSDPEAMLRLAERPADVVLADTALTRPDSVGFTRRVLARSPGAAILLLGAEDPGVAAATIAAGARGLIQGSDHDLVSVVAKAILLLGGRPGRGGAALAGGALAGGGQAGGPVGAGRTGGPGDAGGQPAAGQRLGSVVRAPTGPGREGPGGDAPGAGRPPGDESAVRRRDDPESHAGAGETTGEQPTGPAVVPAQRGDDPNAPTDPATPAGAAPGHPAYPSEKAGPDGPGGVGPGQEPRGADAPGGAGRSAPVRRPVLTEREMQVLVGMADGKSNAEIGRELFVSEDTVKTHARRLFRKLGARDRAHAVAAGFRAGLVA